MSILGLFFPKVYLPRVTQETDSHCGPAVIQMLFAHLHRNFTQDEIVTAARVRSRILAHGTRPDHLARATAKLAPDVQFWFKQRATLEDLVTLIKQHHLPVGVNWQGLFYTTEEEQNQKNPHGEHGHYSVVIDIDPQKDTITIMDPYADFSTKPRVFSFQWFEKRWWDVDDEIDKKTGHKDTIKTKRLIFLIAPKTATFPKSLGLQLPNKLSILQFNPKAKGKIVK